MDPAPHDPAPLDGVVVGADPDGGVGEDGVWFERISPQRMQAVQDLDRELFPVSYTQAFYDTLYNEEMVTLLACTAEDGLIGLVTARVIVTHTWPCLQPSRNGYVNTFGVRSAHRRRKIGTRLLTGAINELARRGCEDVQLHVLTDNYPALSFYRRHGFHTAQLLENHYYIDQQYCDAYRMICPLTSAPSPFAALWSGPRGLLMRLFGRKAEALEG